MCGVRADDPDVLQVLFREFIIERADSGRVDFEDGVVILGECGGEMGGGFAVAAADFQGERRAPSKNGVPVGIVAKTGAESVVQIFQTAPLGVGDSSAAEDETARRRGVIRRQFRHWGKKRRRRFVLP